MPTRVASVNLKFTLTDAQFEAGLREVLAREPDLVALQEVGKSRNSILQRIAREGQYEWTRPRSPNGDPVMPVMWRRSRFVLRACRPIRLARREYVGRLEGRKSNLPASWATEGIFDDLADHQAGPTVLLNMHLTAEVQLNGKYRTDLRHRLRVQRHRQERWRLGRRARFHKRHARTVYVAGDTNYDGMRLGGFINCWLARSGGTFGHRAVDCVFGETRGNPTTVKTPSDHRAVICTYH